MQAISVVELPMAWNAILFQVKQTGAPVIVTSEGVCIAEIHPPSGLKTKKRRLGGMKDTVKIWGDIITPACDEHEWEVLNA